MQNYSSLHETHEPDEEAGGPLVHVAEPSRARWNHIQDLDSFFVRMYQYHQRHGFFCMLLQEILELIQFVFMVCLTAYVLHGIDYPVLFKDVPQTSKVTIRDVLYTPGECISRFTALTWIAIVIAMTVWSLKLIRGVYHLFYFWDIKQFYNTALKIDDGDLDNLTWSMVQTKVRIAQMEQQMCIHKRDLSELDIYHRILRQQNYLIAMVNKKLLPPRLNVPFLGEVVYWTAGLRLNMQLLLFWSPWSPFEHSWQLREEYKKSNLRQELSYEFGKQILWLAAANFVFAPIIFLWQILHAFFSYAAIIRKEPSVLAIRRWSLYGRLYLRHFNELEHELQARLTRAYRPASKYLSSFSSPVGTIISESIGFFSAAILAVLVGLSLWDEDVLAVEHILTVMTALTIAVAVLRTISPEETTSQDLENLLTRVMYNTHYMPAQWQGQAHTHRVRKEIEQLFQYGFVSLLETILSPILTPFILWWYVYPRALEFVDFFRCFTVSVVGVGDVCSFAQMDIQKNGNPDWHETTDMTSVMSEAAKPTEPEQYKQADDGKVEMSLMHFRSTNPSWKPPESVQAFVKNVQNQSSMIASLSNQDRLLDDSSLIPGMWRIGEPCNVDALNVEIPLYTSNVWRTRAMSAEEPPHLSRMWTNEGISPSGIREMALNATYLHNLNSMKTENRTRNTAQETTPLLINR